MARMIIYALSLQGSPRDLSAEWALWVGVSILLCMCNKCVLCTLDLEIALACVKEVGADKHYVAPPFWMGVSDNVTNVSCVRYITSNVCEDGTDEHNGIFQYGPLRSAINIYCQSCNVCDYKKKTV